ncbi:MAG: MobA/MobL family protein [Ruminiclostridium sp.]|nr:MobA/MobL family protein [Ruminiclostridium sp.]
MTNSSRSAGASCVAKAAYIAGEKIKNERDGVTHDYRRKHEVVHEEILLPAGAPERFRERSVLWNATEKKETRKNSQTARSIDAALPRELSRDEQIDLVRNFVAQNFTSKGMCADFAIHDKQDGNPHVHILLTTRRVNANGFTTKDRSWNDKALLEQWRESWADWCNHKLYFVSDERIDHRSYKDQGIDKIPTVHLGAGACAIEKKGKKTDRGLLNLQIEIKNTKYKLDSIQQEIGKITKEHRDLQIKFIEEEVGCPYSELAMYKDKGDFISVLKFLLQRRSIPYSVTEPVNEWQKLVYAKKNYDEVNSVIENMNKAKEYVFDHGYYPPDWNEILKTYIQLRKQEDQQKQQSVETPEKPKPDTTVKSKNTSKPLRH